MLIIYVNDGLVIKEIKQSALQQIDYLKKYLTVKTMEFEAYLWVGNR